MNFVRQPDLPYPQPWEFIIERIFNNKRNGFFVDVGAYDGVIVSNTFYLENCLDWNGICFEPNPRAFDSLQGNRKSQCFNYGISDTDNILDFVKVNGYAEMLSCFKDYASEEHIERINHEIRMNGGSIDTIEVPIKRLDSFFEEYEIKKIDYLSIDTEGNELRVLKSIDFEKCSISVISAENNDGSSEVSNFLKYKGFEKIANVCGDDIYLFRN